MTTTNDNGRPSGALSSPAPISHLMGSDGWNISYIDILREWFGGERYARDYEYLDANYREAAQRIVDWLSSKISAPAVSQMVMTPTTADEAEMMEKIGFAYLREHAPERLTPEGLARPAPNAVRIKPLEWRAGYRDGQVEISQATTIGGLYQVRVLFNGVVWLDSPDGTKACCGSDAEAKNAAQADHERLIRAALSTPEDEG